MTEQMTECMNWGGIALAFLMGAVGLCIMGRQIWRRGIGPYNLQGLGLVLLVPTILVLAILGKLQAEVIAALLGSVAGYIFGRGEKQ